MRHTYKTLHKLRSGQMVWRVLFFVERTDNFDHRIAGRITPTWVMGKKILYWFRDIETNAPKWSSMKVLRKGVGDYGYSMFWDTPNPMSVAGHLSDLMGHGAFSNRRQAERFVREVESGLHSDFRERLISHFEMDDEMFDKSEKWFDEYDSGDEGLRPAADDAGWNESEGHGA